MDRKVFKTVEELEEYLKTNKVNYRRIIPQETSYLVEKENGYLLRFFKPQPGYVVLEAMKANRFPERYLHLIEKKAIDINRPAVKALLGCRGAVLEGPTGTGKTTACVFRIFHLTRYLKCIAPMYIPCMGPSQLSELYQDIVDADCYLVDDLNPIALERSQFRHFIYDLVYHCYEKRKRMFITTNAKIEKLGLEEPAVRRLAEMCKRIVVKE